MATSDKNIIITPNIGQNSDPKIAFSGANTAVAAQTINLNVYPTDGGTISFEGSAGQLFSITNKLTGTIFSVNDVSGIPSIEVLDTGLVKLAQYSGNILLGTGTDNATDKLQVNGSISGTVLKSNIAVGTAPLTVVSTTRVSNLNAATAGNADTVTNGVYTTGDQTIGGTKTLSGLLVGRSSTNTDVNSSNDGGSFSVRGNSSTVAAMTFHRTGAYAINMGLGTDNVFRIGGWSASNNAFQLTGTGNLTLLGTTTAPAFSSSIATGTAPLTVTSTTKVTNLNADLLDGANLGTSWTDVTGGTIPVRHGSGYLYSNYFNTPADITATSPSHVAIQTASDNYIRWQTLAQFKTSLAISGGQFFGAAATKAIAYNSNTISENVTVTSGNNGISAGPITIATGFTVTVANGANWVIV
jgi:hypothetical protein